MDPVTREEQMLADVASGVQSVEPVTREEQWYHDMAEGSTEMEPVCRKEYFYKAIVDSRGSSADLTDVSKEGM